MPNQESRPPEPAGAPLAEGQERQRLSLTDLLLRPLGDDLEMRHIFRGDIEERLRNSSARVGEILPNEAAAWLASQPAAVAGRRPRLLLPLLVVAGLLTLIGLTWEFYDFLPSLISSPGTPQVLRDAGERQLYRIPPHREDNPLLDVNYNPAEAAEKSWRAHPDDPVLYYYYLRKSVYTPDELPRDYEATWKRLDPDNAFWLLYQARLTLCHAGTSLSGGVSKPPPHGTPPAVGNAVAMILKDAARLPHCHSYDILLREFLDEQRQVPVTFTQADALGMWRTLRYGGPDYDGEEWTRLSNEAEAHRPLFAADREGVEKLRTWVGEIRDEVSAAGEVSGGMERTRSLERAGGMMGLRVLTVLSAAVALGLAGVLILRQFPVRGRAGRMALCVRQVLDPQRVLTLVLKYVAPPVLLVVVFAFVIGRVQDNDMTLLLVTVVAPVMLLVLALMVESARREVSRRTAFLGLRSTAFQRRLGWVMPALAGVSAGAVISGAGSDGSMIMVIVIAGGGCYGAVLLWLGVKWLLGFVSPTANVRHRLIAGRLVPVMLITVVMLNVVALCLHPVERYLVKKAVNPSAQLP